MVDSVLQIQTTQGEKERKQKELEQLQSVLSQLELDYINLQVKLHVFEIRYLQQVGQLIATLDEIEAQIFELLTKLFPADEIYEKKAKTNRARAEQSYQEAKYASEQPKAKLQFLVAEDLKNLYREVAKKVHPDYAISEEDRTRRSEWMKQANQAFEEKDYERLKEILSNAELLSYYPADYEETEIKLLAQKIVRVEAHIEQVKNDIQQLLNSELNQLMQRAIEAEKNGQDLLQKIADDLKHQIKVRKIRLQELTRINERSTIR